MVVRHRRIGETVELCELIYITPYRPVVGMENMRTVPVNIDAFHLFGVDIPSDMRPPVNHQNRLPGSLRPLRKHGTIKPGADNQVVISHKPYTSRISRSSSRTESLKPLRS